MQPRKRTLVPGEWAGREVRKVRCVAKGPLVAIRQKFVLMVLAQIDTVELLLGAL